MYKYQSIYHGDNYFPDNIKNDIVYVLEDETTKYRCRFICPCGCKEVLTIRLKGPHPFWKIINEGGFATIEPSINKMDGCRAHFSIKQGNIIKH